MASWRRDRDLKEEINRSSAELARRESITAAWPSANMLARHEFELSKVTEERERDIPSLFPLYEATATATSASSGSGTTTSSTEPPSTVLAASTPATITASVHSLL